ncbi:MAG: hypothetical protein U0326_23790 [Polyangiales bacterium]
MRASTKSSTLGAKEKPAPSGSCSVGGAGARSAGGSAAPSSRWWIHPATVGHERLIAREPTTRPKWPASTVTNETCAAGAAFTIARTAAGRASSSLEPTNARTGQVMSAREAARPSSTKPPDSMRLCTTNWSTNSRNAGPGHATNPSPPRKRRRASRRTSAPRSWRLRTNSTRCSISLRVERSLKPVAVSAPGSASMRSATASTAGSTARISAPSASLRTAGRFLCRSTGLPKVTTDATPAARTKAAA